MVICFCAMLPAVVLIIVIEKCRIRAPQLYYSDPAAVYAAANVTNILIPSSIVSTLIFMTIGDILKLTSLRTAWKFLHPRPDEAPPNYRELRTAISLVSQPTVSNVIQFVKLLYTKDGSQRRRVMPRRLPGVLMHPGRVAAITLFLAWAIFACDTWLHAVATSVQLTYRASPKLNETSDSTSFPAASFRMLERQGWDEVALPDASNTTVQMVNVSRNLEHPANSSDYYLPLQGDEWGEYTWHTEDLSSLHEIEGIVFFTISRDNLIDGMEIDAQSIGIRTTCDDVTQYCPESQDPPRIPRPDLHCPSGAELLERIDQVKPYDVLTGRRFPGGTGSNPIQFLVMSSSPDSYSAWCSTTVTRLNYTMVGGTVRITSLENAPNDSAEVWYISGIIAVSTQSRHISMVARPLASLMTCLACDFSVIPGIQFSKMIMVSLLRGSISFPVAYPDSWYFMETIVAARIPIIPFFVLVAICSIYTMFALFLLFLSLRVPRERTLRQADDDEVVFSNLFSQPETTLERIAESGWRVEKEIAEGLPVAMITLPWVTQADDTDADAGGAKEP